MQIRLQKYIRDSIGISRRKAEDLISAGKVKVNGQIAQLGSVVNVETDNVLLEGKEISRNEKKIYIVLNKPSGYITTRSDEQNRPTVYDLIPSEYKHLFPVGRLDYDTEGLLLLTNDGDFTYKLTHPKFEIEKEYEVVLDRNINNSQIEQIKKGVNSDLIKAAPAKVFIQNDRKLNLIIHEGQKREIKLIFKTFGIDVLSLKRIRVHSLKLADLSVGTWRLLTSSEIRQLS